MVMVCVALSGHINMMVLDGVESGVVRIETSSDICVGRFTSEVFLICNEHHGVIPVGFLTYRAETHDGVFAKGWKGLVMLQKLTGCFLADSKLGDGKFHCHGFILSNA